MKIILWIALLYGCIIGATETIDAQMLLEQFRTHHAMAINYRHEQSRLKALTAIPVSGAPYTLFGSLASVRSGGVDKEAEYTFGVSKQIMLPSELSRIKRSSDLEMRSALMAAHQELIAYMYDLLLLYHQSCLAREKVALLGQIKQQMEALGKKNERAYALGEISKKDYMLWQLQQRKMALELEREKGARLTLFRTLQGYFGNHLKIAQLDCSDLYPLALPSAKSNIEELLEYQIELLQAHKSAILGEEVWMREVEVSLSYEHEYDTQRYRAALSLPLEFTSDASRLNAQAQRIKQMQHRQNLETFKMQKRKALQAAYTKLETIYKRHEALEGPLSQDAIALFELTQSAYSSGEANALELIAVQQQVIDILMQIQESKEAFYDALFAYNRLGITGKEFE